MELQEMINLQSKEPSLRVQIANTHPKLAKIDDGKIAEVLIYLYKITGVPIEKPQTNILIGYMKNSMSFYSLLDLINGFTLAINRKLDIDDPNPYNSFSTLYIEKIMQSYHRYRFNVLETVKKQEALKPSDVPFLSPSEKFEALQRWAVKTFKIFCEHGEFLNYGSPLYDRLKASGIINFTPEREEQLKSESAHNVTRTSRTEKSQSVGQAFILMNNSSYTEAFRYHALKTFFNDLISTNTDLTELFDNVSHYQTIHQ